MARLASPQKQITSFEPLSPSFARFYTRPRCSRLFALKTRIQNSTTQGWRCHDKYTRKWRRHNLLPAVQQSPVNINLTGKCLHERMDWRSVSQQWQREIVLFTLVYERITNVRTIGSGISGKAKCRGRGGWSRWDLCLQIYVCGLWA